MNMAMQTPLCQDLEFCEYMPRSGLAGLYGSYTLYVLRNLHTESHDRINVHACEQKGPLSPHPLQHLLSEFLMTAILTEVSQSSFTLHFPDD